MAQIPHADPGLICPLHKVDMSEVCHTCPLWILVRGKDPQSNAEIDLWNCSFAWLPKLLIENSQLQHQTGAAVESARNEAVKSHAEMVSVMMTGDMRAARTVLSQRIAGAEVMALPPAGGKKING